MPVQEHFKKVRAACFHRSQCLKKLNLPWNVEGKGEKLNKAEMMIGNPEK